MKAKIQEYKRLGNELEKEVKAFVQDTSKPLAERWEVFELAEMGDRDSWTAHLPALDEMFNGEVVWYDDFNVERKQTVVLADIICRLIARGHERGNITEEGINKAKEEILADFIWSFEHDW